MSDDRLGFIPVKAPIPWGKPALVEIPVKSGSDDYLRGMRSRTYLGHVCSHFSKEESEVCVQPAPNQTGVPSPCIPFDPEQAKITVLDGKLADYS